MMGKAFILLCMVLFPVSVSAQTGSDYYPLNVNNRWVHTTSVTGDAEPPSKRIVSVVTGTDRSSGRECFMLKSGDPQGTSGYHWLAVNPGGAVVDCALGAANGLKLVEWDPPHIILPHNAGRLGAVWYVQFVLHSDDHPDSTIIVTETYTIESTSETVVVPAGKFKNCIVVRGELPAVDDRPATVVRRYYAKNVGEVISVRESPGGTVKHELIEYKVYGR